MLAKRQWYRQIRPLENIAALRQETLQQALKAMGGRGERRAQKVGNTLGELLGNDQGLHALTSLFNRPDIP
ncbi:hypothetical protein D9M71_762560 [compost metagenome]